jgi:hypothetical protein
VVLSGHSSATRCEATVSLFSCHSGHGGDSDWDGSQRIRAACVTESLHWDHSGFPWARNHCNIKVQSLDTAPEWPGLYGGGAICSAPQCQTSPIVHGKAVPWPPLIPKNISYPPSLASSVVPWASMDIPRSTHRCEWVQWGLTLGGTLVLR